MCFRIAISRAIFEMEVPPMERIWSTELPRHTGERVRLAGWLHCLRRLSKVSFLILRDGKGLAQVVIEDSALAEEVASWHHESVLTVEGLAAAEPKAPIRT